MSHAEYVCAKRSHKFRRFAAESVVSFAIGSLIVAAAWFAVSSNVLAAIGSGGLVSTLTAGLLLFEHTKAVRRRGSA